jgi:HD superfamily phosphodiesterase
MRIADLEVVDSPIVKESIELAQTLSPPYLFNHVMRSWLLATLVAPQAETPPDPELLAVAVILHDLAGP